MLALLFTSLSGCELISISEDVSYDSGDRALPLSTLDKIELGATNRLWLEKNLGKPDAIESEEGVSTLKYQFSEQVAQRVRVFLLFQYKGSNSRQRTLFITLKDDVVQKAWLEGAGQLEAVELGRP